MCLPTDRQDPRIQKKKSFMDKWNEHIQIWKRWSSAKGMTVVFEYWGEHEFSTRLSQEEHRGRFYFWFHLDLFSHEWFRNRIDEAIVNVGPRYSPELDVQLPIAHLFHALGKTQEFTERAKKYLKNVRKLAS